MKKIIILTALIINSLAAFGQIVDGESQPKENSPLSRIGLGNLTPQYLAPNSGLGGMTAAYRDRFSFNPFNPASVAYMRMTAYEIGLYAKNNNVKSGSTENAAWSGNLGYIALGFPTYSVINEVLDRKKRETRWGMGFSLMPYSTVGYSVNSTSKIADTVTVGNFFLGNGGTYRFLWSNGVEYKGFSVGANVGFLFGRNSVARQLALTNVPSSYIDDFTDSYTMAGFSWNLGVQYDIAIGAAPKVGEKDKQKHLVLGLYGNPATPFATSATQLYRRSFSGSNDTVGNVLTNFSDKSGTGKLPSELTLGVMYEDGLDFHIGAEYKLANWSEYKNEATRQQTLANSGILSVGTEFILDKSKLKSNEEKMRYRLGFKTGNDARILNGNQVSTWAVTGGLCLPLRVGRGQQISYLNLGLEYGKLDAKVLSENYFRINLGFTLNDNTWFLKRKFN
jgi:hypothetical protein